MAKPVAPTLSGLSTAGTTRTARTATPETAGMRHERAMVSVTSAMRPIAPAVSATMPMFGAAGTAS
ncbi:hypothetical protein GCM10027090_34190 [Sinomonas soli]